MPEITELNTGKELSHDEELSNEQIKALLQGAEARLRQQMIPTASQKSFSLPALKPTTESTQSCITYSKGKPAVNPKYIAEQYGSIVIDESKLPETKLARKLRVKEEKEASAGPQWFNMPKTNLTPQLKRDLQLLKMRSVLDPKRHYKKDNGKFKPPPFSQTGTIIEAPTEYFSARLNKKQRKQTLADEILAGEKQSHRFKNAYDKVQIEKTSGRKAFYKAVKARRARK